MLIAAGILVVAIGAIFIFRNLISEAVERTKEHRAEGAGAAVAVEVAQSTRAILDKKENLAAAIEGLTPPLVEVGSAGTEIDRLIRDLFVRRPVVELGMAASHPADARFQQVTFTIRGRITAENFDAVLERLETFPILLEVTSATLDLAASPVAGEGEGTIVGWLAARFE